MQGCVNLLQEFFGNNKLLILILHLVVFATLRRAAHQGAYTAWMLHSWWGKNAYCIAQNFRGTKHLQIGLLQNFWK